MIPRSLKIYTDTGNGDNNPSFKGLDIISYSFQPVRMGTPKLTATLMYDTCLDDEWTGEEYVVLGGERYYIRDTPTSSKDNTDARYRHEIVFTSERTEKLGEVYFYDTVYSQALTKDKPCSNSTTFSFYGTIDEFVDRLNCAFKYAGIGDSILNTKTHLTTDDTPAGDGYCAMYNPYLGDALNVTKELSFEDTYLIDAISQGYEAYEIPFEYKGRAVIFGAESEVVDHTFEYGHDNELLSVSKKNANAKVINRITMVGSSENIPYYYPNDTEYGNIGIFADNDNSVITSDMVEVVNRTQLLSRLSPGGYATLVKYNGSETESAVTVDSYQYAVDSDPFTEYVLDKTISIEVQPHQATAFWHIAVKFDVAKPAEVVMTAVNGQIWKQNQAAPVDIGDMMNVRFVSLEKDNAAVGNEVRNDEDGMYFGRLEKGEYVLKFDVPISVADPARGRAVTAKCRLSGVSIGVDESYVKNGFYWQYDGKDYKIGEFGIKIAGGVTDAMIGDSFCWNIVGKRMNYQQNLMPSKFYDTKGDERFYNAVNGLYIDPDTNKPYAFPNPYTDGTRSEYIHRNEDIKPTIEGVANSRGELLGVIAGIAYDMNDNDSLSAGATEEDKNDALKYEHSYFYINLHVFNGEYGFNLFQHASQTDPMTIQMTSGNCNGCKFKIQAVEFTDETGLVSFKNPVRTNSANGSIVAGDYADKVKKDGFQEWQQDTSANSIWICVQKDAETFGVIIPNKANGYLPAVGDTFNIINIDLPDVYIRAAEKRLEQDGLRFMADNNEEKFTFDISASRIFFAENPEVLAALDEYSKLKVKYNEKTYELYVSSLNIKVNGADALPDIQINLTDTISVGQNFVQKVAERAASLIANATTMGGNLGTGGGGLSAVLADKRYLNKQKADRTPYKVGSDVGFEIGEFVSGSSGGLFYIDPDTGQSYIEVDRMKVRMKAVFEELQIAIVDSIGGKLIISPGGSIKISYVETLTDSYRCYFKADEFGEKGACRLVVGDQVQCRSVAVQSGTTYNASNTYFWRLVTAVDADKSYVEISKTDADTDSDVPKAGDTICQLGSRTDQKRQSAIILSTVDEFAPCVTLYSGINSYSLDGKAVVEYGVDKTKTPPRPFFHCFGEAYVGPKDKSTYVQYTPENGVEIKGKLSVESTIGDKTLEDYIKDTSAADKENIQDYIDAALQGVQDQIDGVVETWFYNGVPTLDNYPANEWDTEDLKIAHLGDLYYDNDTGTAYRFSQNVDKTFFWAVITDDAITKALAAAKDAQDTADGKRRVFTAQPTTEQEYDEGDLWVNATYGTQYTNDILRCIIEHKPAGVPFDIDHWTLASKYTDDSALNQFIADYQTEIADIKTQLDGKAETWYQAIDPSTVDRQNGGWLGESDAMHKGDLWYCTADIEGTDFKAGTTWYWDGSAWKRQNVPDSVFDAIDGKASIFVSQPTRGYRVNDLWFLEDTYTLHDGTHPEGTLAVAIADMDTVWDANDWEKKDRYTDDTLAQAAMDRFTAWAADGVFSPTEIKELELERERIDGDKASFDSKYGIFGSSTIPDVPLDTAKSAYDGAYTAYRAALSSVLDSTPDADGCVTVPTDFKSKMQHYYNVRAQYEYTLALAQQKYTEVIAGQYEYLRKAMGDASTTIGGLFLTSIIRVGENNKSISTQTVWSGLNGVQEKSNFRDISYWAGGDMVDLFNDDDTRATLPTGARPAASVIRMDGSTYFAKGNVGFKANGGGWLAGNNITWDATGAITFGNGIKIDLGGGNDTTLGGLNTKLTNVENSMATVLALANKLSNLFTPFLGSTQKNWGDISTDADFDNIRINAGAWTESFLSARGQNDNGTSGAGAVYLHELEDTVITNPASGEVLTYNGQKWVNQAAQTGLDESALATYLTTNNYAKKTDIPSLTGYATQTWVQQQGYLTSHQTIRTLTIQKNGTSVGTFNPTGSANATLNITDVASASTLSSHIGDTTAHITSAERTKWNKVVADFNAITGADSNSIIDKWEEVVAFLDTYTEADTLAGLLSNKADKTTSINAGTGLTGGGTLAASRTLSLAASGVTAGTYFKTTVDTYGRVTSGSNPTTLGGFGITDAYTKTEADGRYVNLTGAQTISGAKTFSSPIKSTFTSDTWLNGTKNAALTLNHNNYGAVWCAPVKDGRVGLSTYPADNNNVYLGYAPTGQTSNSLLKSLVWTADTGNLSVDSLNTASIVIGGCTISWDSANGMLKFDKGIYSEGSVSALGANPNSSGGGGGLIQTVYAYKYLGGDSFSNNTTTDTFNAYTINRIYTDLSSRISSLEGGSALSVVTSGSGNAITDISKSGNAITATKGATFLPYAPLNNGLRPIADSGWGNGVGNTVAIWADGSGDCAFKFKKDNPSSGKMSMLIDGTVYINEGVDAVASQSWANGRYPLKDGTGASGNWNINIKGNAANAATVGGYPASRFMFNFDSSEINLDTAVTSGVYRLSNTNANMPSGFSYGQMLVMHGGHDTIGQLLMSYSDSGRIAVRSGNPSQVGGSGSWGSWRTLAFTTDIPSLANYVTLNTAQTITGAKTFVSGILMGGTGSLGNAITWARNTDFASIFFKNTGDGDADSYLGFKTGDNGNEYFRFSMKMSGASSDTEWATIKAGGITANSFVKYGGTSNQVLMADGSTQPHYKANDVTTAEADDGVITPLAMHRWTAKTYVTSLGTSGNYLTWTKNGAVNNITVPYATLSATVVGTYSGNGGAKQPNAYGRCRVGFFMSSQNVNGNGNYKDWILMDCYGGDDVGGAVAIGVNRQNLGAYIMRSAATRSAWAESAELIGTHNYASILDSRYYTETEVNSLLSGKVSKSGDTMTGSLSVKASTDRVLHVVNTSTNASWNLINFTTDMGRYFGYNASSDAFFLSRRLAIGAFDNTVWHAGNDGSGSGLDADLLDGKHLADILASNVASSTYSRNLLGRSTSGTDYPTTEGNLIFAEWNTYSDNRWYLKAKGYECRVSYANNSGYATQLATARTIWGQSFNGTANVSGNMTGVGSITASGTIKTTATRGFLSETATGVWSYLRLKSNANFWDIAVKDNSISGALQFRYNGSDVGVGMVLATNGNVGIATSSPSYKLDVAGDIRAQGWLRTSGQTGWYSDTYSGGIYMTDSTWVRIYNNKSFYGGSGVIRTDGALQVGDSGSAFHAQSNGNVTASGLITGASGHLGTVYIHNSDEINRFGGALYLQHRGGGLSGYGSTGNIVMCANGGNVGFGTASPAQKVHINGSLQVEANSFLNGNVYQKYFNYYQRNTVGVYMGVDNDDNFVCHFHENKSWVKAGFKLFYADQKIQFWGPVYSVVGVYSDGYVSARGQNTSDARLKTDIRDFRATDIIRSLRPKSFRWNADARHRFNALDTDDVQYGLIAQETEVTNPWLVDRNMFGDGYMGIRYEKLIPVLLKGALEIIDTTNDHERRIENLERENSRLRMENAEFRKRIGELESNFI